MKNKLERINNYQKKLDKIKRYTEINETKTLSQIALNLHIDHSLIAVLRKNNILVEEKDLFKWNIKIPVTTTLAEKIIELNDAYYQGLKSRQVEYVPIFTKKIKKKKVKRPSFLYKLKTAWNILWNN